jgi:hypothetical protein
MVAWWGTVVECASAFARERRAQRLSSAGEGQARRVLSSLAEAWTQVEASDDVRAAALRLLALHPLRSADALQLAAALVWADYRPRGLAFVSLDERLCAAATAEGFEVVA